MFADSLAATDDSRVSLLAGRREQLADVYGRRTIRTVRQWHAVAGSALMLARIPLVGSKNATQPESVTRGGCCRQDMLINMEKGPDAYPGTLGSMGIIVGWHKLLVGGGGLPNVRPKQTEPTLSHRLHCFTVRSADGPAMTLCLSGCF